MCKDPCIPKVDVVQEIGTAIASAVTTVTRLAVRVGCHWFSDDQLDHGRRILCWRFMIEAAAAATLTAWLGRPAMWVFAGVAVGSWWLGRVLLGEQRRRFVRLERARPPVCQSPVTLPDDIDAELTELAAGQVPCGECPTCLANREAVPA